MRSPEKGDQAKPLHSVSQKPCFSYQSVRQNQLNELDDEVPFDYRSPQLSLRFFQITGRYPLT
ncbi:hypothetical protein [Arthrospira platensis]|jgi:hypothetical protein|uniref:Uncharacterized protein n=1 Tax=Limnospira platensis NIES-46 TaxID=1236695 RepID=A0A5M3T4E1_LIMPL|nr:hypothetical protein [Arthrospira platensis]AMW26965.1 hypothetical protein AP285_02100 [Arthrospira platensis YZ]KDR54630.1 hypothetical protein APPUASWS_027475 [Arthrospira platensis str. Paraca]MBD2670772.1 hypothetical protein [Arthrospira platensis FACHB-439]MBD2711331.1 hypothetical protein [Arthrospira platensis FACHB-835]MDF2211632.1 hypothetical protein [Arthrospira platensis NCB002]MDT9183994.1 hypothetical protein [Limnospira sp. PMC 289.06]MDT9296216.1 hypothetical protein [Ar